MHSEASLRSFTSILDMCLIQALSTHCPLTKQKLLLTSFAEAEAQTLWVFWLPVSVCLSPHPYRANGCLFSFGASVFWGLLADLRSFRLDKALWLGRRPGRLVLSASFAEVCSTVFSCSSFCCFSLSSLSFSKERKSLCFKLPMITY